MPSKEKKKRKRKEGETDVSPAVEVAPEKEKSAKKEKSKEERRQERKEKKKRKRKESESSDASPAADAPPEKKESTEKDEAKKSKEERRREREQKKASKKAEKAALLDKVPKTDEDGIAYTKIQIRRMLRRVKRGLPPVPTEEEERERLRDIKKEKKLEEKELAGMVYDREKERESEAAKDGGSGEDGSVEDDEDGDKGDDVKDDAVDEKNVPDEGNAASSRPVKKKKSSKPVPSDYICQACKNKHSPPHWIYDCPDKIRKPGINQVKKNMKGMHMPDPRKVYVSGMPFGVKYGDVRAYFEDKAKCGKLAKCHLITFKDEFARCKGDAFLTFETEEGAKKAISASGDVMDIGEKKEKKKGGDSGTEKKVFRLKVTKVSNKAAMRKRNRFSQ